MPPITSDDLALLQRFEPILCFNKGEQFYPMDVDRYLAEASLCVQRPQDVPETLVPRGQLTSAVLSQPQEDEPGAVYYLSVADPLSAKRVHAFHRTSTLRDFRVGPGRLVRVGLLARFADLLFSLSLLLRGRAPGGMAAGSARRYQATQARGERYCYYGRVSRERDYTILQYWFFYAFNDWRSSFHGVNDHEGDWEMITVYAAEDPAGAIEPCWLAYSAHDSDGDDLRRRWDDPDLKRIDDHPIVYCGAGSHANYFFRGEYLPAVTLPYTQGIARIWLQFRRVWARLGQGDEPLARDTSGFRIPFVDYARGDGLRIGHRQQAIWQMRLLQATETTPAPAWVDGFRGLWGLYSGDPLGENAPPGPKYERNGLQRLRWYDPLGWSGLDKVPAPAAALPTLAAQQQSLREEREQLTREIAQLTDRLARLEMEAEAVRGVAMPRSPNGGVQRQIRQASAELERVKADRAANDVAQASCAAYVVRLTAGDRGDPRAHLHHPPLPSSPTDLRLGKLAAFWSAISIGVLLLAFVVLSRFSAYLAPGALVLLGIYGFVEALFHRTLQSLIRAVVVGLAILTTVLLVVQFFTTVALLLLLLIGVFIIVDNVREVLA